MNSSSTAEGKAPGILLFILSLSTLAVQIAQVRIFSYSLNPSFVYMVISLALLGFGASGTLLSVVPKLKNAPLAKTLPMCLALFAGSSLLANFLFARASQSIAAERGISLLSSTTLIFASFSIPFFFAGMGVALVLLSNRELLSRRYFVNLIGSGVGSFIVYPFMEILGSDTLVVAAVLPTAIAAFWVGRHQGNVIRFATGSIAALVLVSCFFAPSILPFQPDESDFYADLKNTIETKTGEPLETKTLYSEWDPVGRIEIFEFPEPWGLFSEKIPALLFVQDAGAPSILYDIKNFPEMEYILAKKSLYGIATSIRPKAKVLIMGLGGGPDLIAALGAGAAHVTGVEINRAVIDVLGNKFRDYLQLPKPGSKKLDLVHSDGRAYAMRFKDEFDVIQMTGADTYAAGAISGSILSENYLYTEEAFSAYLDALKPDGLLAITRFGLEPIKIMTTAEAVLKKHGISDPNKHVISVKQGDIWFLTLVKKSPFTDDEVRAVRNFVKEAQEAKPSYTCPMYDLMKFSQERYLEIKMDPGLPEDKSPAAGFAGLKKFVDAMPDHDFTPSTDDRPFFLQLNKFTWPSLSEIFADEEIDNPLLWSMTRYSAIVVQMGILAAFLILGPLLILAFKRKSAPLAHALPMALYFFSIGLGFMWVEIGLMQRFSLFLGHPNYSISVVLFTLLVFSGIGSYVSGRWRLGRTATISLATIAIGLFIFMTTSATDWILGTMYESTIAVRVVISILLLAPGSFFMGMPLPTMLKFMDENDSDFSPWGLGVNGFASVMGSLSTIPLTIIIGFEATFRLGALAYVTALLAYFTYCATIRLKR